jgi:choline dehydrogenase-like flavoprotein
VWRVDFRRQDVVGVRGRFVDEVGRRYGRFEVSAKLVVLAAGARHTPAILKRSLFGDPLIGRGLHTHPNAKVVGVFDERIDPWKGAHQAHQIHQFNDDGILMAYTAVPPGLLATGIPGFGREHGERMRKYNHMLTAGCLIEDEGEGRVRMGPDMEPWMQFKIADADLDKIHHGVRLLSELMFAAGAEKVLLPFGDLPEISSADDLGQIEQRSRADRDIELMTVHIMSSCRMSSSPERGPADAFGRIRGVRGLAVADASCIPSSIGVNPMETIVALSLRNADRWIEDLHREAARRPRRSPRDGRVVETRRFGR